MKNLIVFLLGVVCPFVAVAKITPTQKNYIEKMAKLAVEEMNVSGIPASITLAQAILESSWGKGELAVNANNYFGIKCKGDCGVNVYKKMDDDYDQKTGKKIHSTFKKYTSIEASFKDHTRFLTNNSRYKDLFEYQKNDYINWAIGLQEKHYATNQSYALLLIELIEKHNLHRFDIPVNPNPITKQKNTSMKIPKAHILPSNYIPLCMKAAKGEARSINTHTVNYTNEENYHNRFVRTHIRTIQHKPHLVSKARK